MKVSVQKLPKSQVELKIEIPAEKFKSFIEKAIFNLGKDLEVKGFRKGKVPKEIIEKEIGQEKILKEAAEAAIKENYPKAVRQLAEKIETISQPEIEISKLAKGNPLEFKAKAWVLPEIKLPDYKKIASQVKKREVQVTKEEIEKLKQEKERWERERLRQEILEKIAKSSEAEIPQILIAKEKKRMLENLKRGVVQTLQISFEDYLAKIKKTEKEILDSFEPEAQKKVKGLLALREIGKKEEILVSEKEIQEELKRVSRGSAETEKEFDLEDLKDYIKEVLFTEKTFQLLESFIKK